MSKDYLQESVIAVGEILQSEWWSDIVGLCYLLIDSAILNACTGKIAECT